MRLAVIVLVLVDVLVEDLDDRQRGLVVLAESHKVLNSFPVVLEDAIEVSEAVEHQLVVVLHIVDDVKKSVKDGPCRLLFLLNKKWGEVKFCFVLTK